MMCRESLQWGLYFPLLKQRHLRLGNETDFVTKFDSQAGMGNVGA